MKLKKLLPLTFILSTAFLFMLSSCGSVKKTVYFSNEPDSAIIAKTSVPQTRIQPNDILSITVSSINQQATMIFNNPNITYAAASTSSGTQVQSPGYLVSPTGDITFPVVGEIKVAGQTTAQIQNSLAKMLTEKKLLVDPIVMVRQLNFRVSVLGEVSHPTVVNVPSERISLLEALGMAGDITIYGRKDNVMVIREENGIKHIKRINMNNDELFRSEYYYLKSNDIVYVEANKSKVESSSRSTFILPIILSALSFAAIIVDRIASH